MVRVGAHRRSKATSSAVGSAKREPMRTVWHAPAGSRRSDVGATRSDRDGAASRLHELEAEAASTPSMADDTRDQG